MSKKYIGSLILKLFSGLAFIAVSFIALFFAYGYQSDLTFKNIKKTSIIDVNATYKNTNLYLDGVLQATELPFQIKGVVPGTYNLTVNKPNYLPWQRQLLVRNDFVTRVDDLLLMPEDINSAIKTVNSFKADSQFFEGEKGIVVLRKANIASVIGFMPDGSSRLDDISLSSDKITGVQFFSPTELIVFYDKDLIQSFNTDSGETFTFNLPPKYGRLTLDYRQRRAFFMLDGGLYAVPFDKLGQFATAKDRFVYRIIKEVDQFTLGEKTIIYLEDSKLYVADYDGGRMHLISILGSYDNLSFKKGRNFDFLVLRNKNQRKLFATANGTEFISLTDYLKGDIFIRGDDVLFLNSRNELQYFDSKLQRRIYIKRFDKPINVLGFFADDGHFVFRDELGKLQLADLSLTNVYPLELNSTSKTIFLGKNNAYFLNDKKLSMFTIKREAFFDL